MPIRVVTKESDAWFVATDVCKVLEIGNPSMAVNRLDDDEKGVNTIETPGGTQRMVVINESGLYSLILTSRKEEAKRFKKWITAEVLPSIRKHGMYATAETIEQMLSRPESIQAMLTNLMNEQLKNRELEAKIHADQPKLDTYHRIMDSESTFTLTEVAKENGMTEYKLRSILMEAGVVYRKEKGGVLLLKSGYDDKGYTKDVVSRVGTRYGTTVTNHQTRWTERGRQFIYDLLHRPVQMNLFS